MEKEIKPANSGLNEKDKKRKLNLIVQLCISLLIVCASVATIYAQNNAVAIASFVVGKAFYKTTDSTKWTAIKQGTVVPEGSSVKVGNGSRLTLLYGKSEYRLAQNTEIQMEAFAEGKKEGKVALQSGFAWFNIDKRPGEKFRVSTPTSTAGVRGTSFATMYELKNKTAMNCICEGKVDVSNLDNSSTKMVTAGTGTMIQAGKEIVESSYKDLIVKENSLPAFQERIKSNPILANCLSCHTPKGWKSKGIIRDETYAK
jgi:hypothetical protein